MKRPTVELDGRTYVLSAHDTGQLVQTGDVVVISEREVRQTLAKLDRLCERKGPKFKDYQAKAAAYRQLLKEAGKNG